MRLNAHRTVAALVLLASGSTPWACESRDAIDDNRSGIAHEVPQPLTPGDRDSANALEPWYETCRDISELPPEEVPDDLDHRGTVHDGHGRHHAEVEGKSGGTDQSSKQAGATGTFVVPSTAAYGLLAIGYTKGPNCGLAKVYFDDRYIETIQLNGPSPWHECERIYTLLVHTAKEHRFEVKVEGKPNDGNDAYRCLDYVVADW